ncbi:unnamed protein product [Pedinophyceae sp. YPF-701]|nr:unnamed protein product [Pedinophyceae sp. YPF-701]
MEQEALQAFMDKTSGKLEDAVGLMKEAAVTRTVDSALLTGALRLLEDEGGCSRPPAEVRDAMQGRWTVLWSDIVPFDFLKYIPVDETLTLEKGRIELKGFAGPLINTFGGEYEFRTDLNGFDFTMPEVKVELFGRAVVDKTRDQDMRNYQILYLDDATMAVRTSAGGYTLLCRP